MVDHWMRELSTQHPSVKFTRIFFSNAIPNYPEANLPTVLVYHRHDIAWSMVTMSALAPKELLTRENGKKLFMHALSRVGVIKTRVNDGREGEKGDGGGKLLGGKGEESEEDSEDSD